MAIVLEIVLLFYFFSRKIILYLNVLEKFWSIMLKKNVQRKELKKKSYHIIIKFVKCN